MAEGSSSSSGSNRIGGFSSGLAVLLSEEKPKGNSQNSHLISCFDDIGSHSVERTLEHIFDLPHKLIQPSNSLIDVQFIRSILKNHKLRLPPDVELECCRRCGLSIVDSSGSSSDKVVIDRMSIFGEMKIKEPLLVEGEAAFSSARANACVWKGKWMYEVTLETSGVQQLGWATMMWPFTEWKGVGDVEDSYAYDGKRVSKWNKEPKPYGQPWVVGDVIGCCINLDCNTISFSRNGVPLGIAFDGIRKMGPRVGYYPAISLSEGERCDLNFGARPFKYPIDGFLPIQAPPSSRTYAGYLLRCFTRLLEVQCLDKPDSAYFEKLRRLKRFAPLQELFFPICHGILEEFFSLVHANEGCFQYVTWGELPLFLLGVFGAQEPHDYVGLDQILDLLMKFPGSDLMLLQVIMALSYSCKVASLVLTECPYSGSYPYIALAIHILKRESMMVLWCKSKYFDSSFEGFLSQKNPNKEDLHCLIPSVWWPGSCEDTGCESSMILITSALSGAINKIEQMHRELCTLVIYFVPPVSSSPPLPRSVFLEFLHNFLLRVRGAPHKMTSSSVSSNSALVSLYTVILHFLSEGFCVDSMSCSTSNARLKSGFLHRGGKRSFPVDLFFRYDSNSSGIPTIGRSENHVNPYQLDGEETKEIHWEEGCMDDENSRVTHLTKQKPCCCSTVNNNIEKVARYYGQGTSRSSKDPCSATSERLTSVSTECRMRSSGDSDIINKPSSSVQSESDSGNGSTQQLNSMLADDQSSSGVLREAELLDIMLLLYQLGVAPKFRQAFYYMSHQSQSISLLDDTDKQIRERSCLEQVKRLKEARNIYREELVDCVRQCAWYRIALFSWWKQRGIYATCMWTVQLLLILSNDDSVFPHVPEFYVESLVDSFHALRRSDPPFVSSATFIKHGLAPFVTFVVKHFNDPRILSADMKDLLLHSISAMVQCKDYLLAFESNKEAIESMPRALLLAFDSRSWIPVTNILLRLFKGSGFFSSKHSESSSSVLFQVLLREACIHDESLFSLFLNRLFNTFSWTVTEFSMSIREMQGISQSGDLQHRKCSVVFDLSCSLARVLEFCTREIPQAFLLGSDMNLRRLTEVIIFVLNHIISASDAEFFDMSIRRSGQYQDKTNRTMILAPLVGMITNLMDASADPERTELNDIVGVFASMDSYATVLFGFQYLLEYWGNILREDAPLSKLAQLKKFACYLRSRTETIERSNTSRNKAEDEEGENSCCICYASECDAIFEPCHHKSCHDCITRHLLNGERCFFCNATVSAVVKLEPGGCNIGELRK